MAVKNLRQRIVAFVAGLLLGPTVVWAGLESATYISDLVASNPLSSDLASTADDHIRLLKSTIKTTFPNINGAVSATDEQLSPGGLGANPTGTIGLSAVNGSANTYMRSDGAPALSQAIAPTWTAQHTFSQVTNAAIAAVGSNSNSAGVRVFIGNTSPAADSRYWGMRVNENGDFRMGVYSDANFPTGSETANWLAVERTGTTVDRVTFQTVGGNSFLVGVQPTSPSADTPMLAVNTNASRSAGHFENTSATAPTVYIGSDQTGGNTYVRFYDGGDPDTSTGSITTNGTTTSYVTTSDMRLKKNIRAAQSARSLINSVPIEQYDWIDGGLHVPHGFVAQHLNAVAPECVARSDDPKQMWQVEKACLVPALIKYVQEQDARISRLEADANRRH